MPLPQDVESAANVEFISNYRVEMSPARPDIGTSRRKAPADVSLTVDPVRTVLRVNGGIWIGQKGYTLAVLTDSGHVTDVRNFNTSWFEKESAALAAYIRNLPEGSIVAVASSFDVSRSLTAEAVASLATLGIKGDLRGRFQWAHAAVGVKGGAPGSAEVSIGETRAWCRIGEPAPVAFTVSDIRLY